MEKATKRSILKPSPSVQAKNCPKIWATNDLKVWTTQRNWNKNINLPLLSFILKTDATRFLKENLLVQVKNYFFGPKRP